MVEIDKQDIAEPKLAEQTEGEAGPGPVAVDKQDVTETELAEQTESELLPNPVAVPSDPVNEAEIGAMPVMAKSAPEKISARIRPWLLLIVGLLVGGLAGFYLRPLVTPEATASAAAPLAAVEDSGQINKPDPHRAVMLAVIAGARHFQGDSNAPVTLVEFGDFNCGYCGHWAKETLPQIDEKYIKTGKVRMAYVHYPILGADSMTAAEGAECAAQQDNFWPYHNLLYTNQGIGFTPANLAQLAGELGLDKQAFEACLANFTDRPSLEDDIRLAQVMGVRGTPAFLVNGVPLAGAYPYEDFEQVIEGLLAGKF